jgi:hypothetical protein
MPKSSKTPAYFLILEAMETEYSFQYCQTAAEMQVSTLTDDKVWEIYEIENCIKFS